jgi:putative selenate reductase molybdopterin-binding subunit
MEGDRLVVSASTQVPFHVRRLLAHILGIAEERIRVIKERVGGGFGAKQDLVLEDLCAFVTHATGRPAFFRFTREEEFVASRVRHPTEIRIDREEGRTITAAEMDRRPTPAGVHCLTVR